MKMEQTECSEMSAYKIQTPGCYPEERIQLNKFYIISVILTNKCTQLSFDSQYV